MYNNTFYNAPVIISNNGATVTVFEFKNNIVDCGDGVPLTDAGGRITSHSNNIFHRGGGTLVRSDGSDYSSSDLASGYEPTASSGSPIFKNTSKLPTGFAGAYGVDMAPNSDGLSLQEGSPGVNKGIALGSGFGGSINSVRRPTDASWDIGAYQSDPPAGRAQAGAADSRIVH
jgi:hypothetical protein